MSELGVGYLARLYYLTSLNTILGNIYLFFFNKLFHHSEPINSDLVDLLLHTLEELFGSESSLVVVLLSVLILMLPVAIFLFYKLFIKSYDS